MQEHETLHRLAVPQKHVKTLLPGVLQSPFNDPQISQITMPTLITPICRTLSPAQSKQYSTPDRN